MSKIESQNYAVMNILILILLSLAGILLLVLELFLIPGIGIAGVAGGGCLIGAVVYAYMCIGATAGHITFFAVLATAAIAIYAFYKSRAIEKMGLDTKIDDKVELADPGKKIARLQEQAEEQSAAQQQPVSKEKASAKPRKSPGKTPKEI